MKTMNNEATKMINLQFHFMMSDLFLKFIYSEKATKFCEIFPLLLTAVHTDFAKFCGLYIGI